MSTEEAAPPQEAAPNAATGAAPPPPPADLPADDAALVQRDEEAEEGPEQDDAGTEEGEAEGGAVADVREEDAAGAVSSEEPPSAPERAAPAPVSETTESKEAAVARGEQAPALPPQPQPQPPAPSSGPSAVTTEVVHEFEGHYFTPADVNDVVRVQALYRKQRAVQMTEDKRADAQKAQAERAHTVIEPIMMPEVAEPLAAPSSKHIQPHGESGSHRVGPGKVFSTVDPARIAILAMSGDTRGMHSMYTRMLKTKMWW